MFDLDRTAAANADFARWLVGEPARRPSARVRALFWALQVLLAVSVLPYVARALIKPITGAPKPPPLVDGPGDVRYGLPLARRREIFTLIAATENHSREMGVVAFPGMPWSQEDHRAAFERDAVRNIAASTKITLQQAYLVLDEGVRSQWPGPDGKPLTATVVPLDPRRR